MSGPHWSLRHSGIYRFLWGQNQESWWAREDSNLQPSGYEPLALTIELRAPAVFLAHTIEKLQTFRSPSCAKSARSERVASAAPLLRHGASVKNRAGTIHELARLCYALLIRDIERPSAPQQGLHMLPNFRIVIGAVMFAVLLFAITGAGVVMPDTYKRVGEVPEIGRTMMQRMITDEPAQAQFLALTLMRRADELGRLQERIALEVEMEVETARTEADPDPGIAKQVAIEAPEADAAVPAVAAVPALQPSGAMGTVPAAAPASAADAAEAPPVAATATPNDVPETPAAKPEPEPVRTAALPLKAEDTKPPENRAGYPRQGPASAAADQQGRRSASSYLSPTAPIRTHASWRPRPRSIRTAVIPNAIGAIATTE
jgi:hypothetical protein